MDAEQILHRVATARARLDDAISRVDERWFGQAHAEGAWTAKDQLGHIAAWHRVALGRLTGVAPEDIRDVVRGEYTSDTIDEVNERFLDRDRGRPLEEVRAEFAASYDDLCQSIRVLGPEELARPWLPENPARGTFAQMIAANTYDHYEEHIPLLQALATS